MFSSGRSTGAEHASARSMAMARSGMVCTSQTLALVGRARDAARGRQRVRRRDRGGRGAGRRRAVQHRHRRRLPDARWSAREQSLLALNGTGRAPAGATCAAYRARGVAEMPPQGVLTVTVPGAVDAWCTILERCGTRSLADVLAPAIEYAEGGFPVSEVVAREWGARARAGFLGNDAARRCFAPGGEPPRLGGIVRMPDLAREPARARRRRPRRLLSRRDRRAHRRVPRRERRAPRRATISTRTARPGSSRSRPTTAATACTRCRPARRASSRCSR